MTSGAFPKTLQLPETASLAACFALRERGTIGMEGLLEALPYPNRDEDRVRGLVRALHEEGLVTYDPEGEIVKLPE